MLNFLRTVFIGSLVWGLAASASAKDCVTSDVYEAQTLAESGKLTEIAAITQRCPTEVNVLLAYAQAGIAQAEFLNENPEQQAAILADVWTALDRIDMGGASPYYLQGHSDARKTAAVKLAEMSVRSGTIIPVFASEAPLPVCPRSAVLPVQSLFYLYQKEPHDAIAVYARKIAEVCSHDRSFALNPNYYFALLLGHQASLEPDPVAGLKIVTEARAILDKIVGANPPRGSYEIEVAEVLETQAKLDVAVGKVDPLEVMRGDTSGTLTPKYLEALIGYGVNEVWGPNYSLGSTDESKAKFKAQFMAYREYISKLDAVAKKKGEDMRWVLYRGLSGHAEGKYRTDERKDYKVYVGFPWKATRPE